MREFACAPPGRLGSGCFFAAPVSLNASEKSNQKCNNSGRREPRQEARPRMKLGWNTDDFRKRDSHIIACGSVFIGGLLRPFGASAQKARLTRCFGAITLARRRNPRLLLAP